MHEWAHLITYWHGTALLPAVYKAPEIPLTSKSLLIDYQWMVLAPRFSFLRKPCACDSSHQQIWKLLCRQIFHNPHLKPKNWFKTKFLVPVTLPSRLETAVSSKKPCSFWCRLRCSFTTPGTAALWTSGTHAVNVGVRQMLRWVEDLSVLFSLCTSLTLLTDRSCLHWTPQATTFPSVLKNVSPDVLIAMLLCNYLCGGSIERLYFSEFQDSALK